MIADTQLSISIVPFMSWNNDSEIDFAQRQIPFEFKIDTPQIHIENSRIEINVRTVKQNIINIAVLVIRIFYGNK